MCKHSQAQNIKETRINPEEFYQQLFDSAGEGILLVNNKGQIVMANKRLVDLFGYQLEEILNQNINILIPQNSRPHHDRYISGYFSAPRARSMGKEMILAGLRKDGTEFPIEISLNYFRSNKDMFAIALITDITVRKEAESEIVELNEKLEQRVKERTEQLAESERLYSAIARNFPDGIISVLDRNLNYIFVEGKELTKLGIDAKSLINTSYLERLPKALLSQVKHHFSQVFEGESNSFELSLNQRHYVLDAVPLKHTGTKIDQILLVEKNVTSTKELENEMKKSLERERELSSMKSRFVSMASHEFRTPLGTILSSASLIARYTKDEQQEQREKHVSKIKSSVTNLTSILNDFLSLESLEAGKLTCVLEAFELVDLCETVKEDIQGLLKTGQTIEYKHLGDQSIVCLDKQMMGNALLNLLSNAIKYSHEYQAIQFVSQIEDGQLNISVTDNGIGIPISEQKHLFVRFFRANNATNIKGTGLGLNITKKYIELMGGKIQLTSEEGKGTKAELLFDLKH
ncbi:MAG: PAS domain-containing sensor histidine kinase [Flavobacteriales bacterium]